MADDGHHPRLDGGAADRRPDRRARHHQERVLTVPELPAVVSASELTKALGRHVSQVTVEKSFPTVLSHIFRLRLTYDADAAGAPASLILKAGLLDRPGGPWRPGQREVAFYRQVAPATAHGLLHCFGGHADAESGAWHLLFEDLTDSHRIATAWPLPPTFDQCAAIVRAQARFHASWWNDARLGVSVGTLAKPSLEAMARQFDGFASGFGDRLPAERRALHQSLLRSAPRLLVRAQPRTIVHGDAHAWNCFLPIESGEARLFDWDAWQIGHASDDLAYLMAMHWYPDLRRAFEARLLDHYHDQLLSRGITGYSRAALQKDYRVSVLWQLARAVWQHSIGIPPVIWWNNLERLHLAVDDLDCRALLD
jgi:hypothetical protein